MEYYDPKLAKVHKPPKNIQFMYDGIYFKHHEYYYTKYLVLAQ